MYHFTLPTKCWFISPFYYSKKKLNTKKETSERCKQTRLLKWKAQIKIVVPEWMQHFEESFPVFLALPELQQDAYCTSLCQSSVSYYLQAVKVQSRSITCGVHLHCSMLASVAGLNHIQENILSNTLCCVQASVMIIRKMHAAAVQYQWNLSPSSRGTHRRERALVGTGKSMAGPQQSSIICDMGILWGVPKCGATKTKPTSIMHPCLRLLLSMSR